MKNRVGNIGHDAHFGGAIGGYFLTLVLNPILFETELFYVLILAIPIVILYVMHRTGRLS